MGETKFEAVDFSKLVSDIERNEIVLPDFQRGFVWKDKERQKALIASVLTKLPIGTILLLEIDKNKYAYKKIGFKIRETDTEEKKKTRALLDGQQRVTVLMAFFSNELYEIGESSEFVSPSLKRRYFLKLPKLEKAEEQGDLFGVSSLMAPQAIVERKCPNGYSTDEIAEWIVCIDNVKYKNVIYGDVSNVNLDDLANFCTRNAEEPDGYLIPLYYLYGAATKVRTNQRKRLEYVLEEIARNYQHEILDQLKKNNDADAKIIRACFTDTEDGKEIGEKLKHDTEIRSFTMREEESELYSLVDNFLSARAERWADDIREFLESCISGLELYKIEVEQSNISRAIDIYQNLNLGGKSLDIFDLILARAATQTEKENLLEVVKKYILQDHKEDYVLFKENCRNQIKSAYDNFLLKRGEYSASNYLGSWNIEDNELTSTYCKTLMSTVGTLNYFWDDNMKCVMKDEKKRESFTSQVTKSESLLKINPERIDFLIREACKGIDRACFFLQMRCGIRNIKEIQYKLILVILSVIFTRDEWFNDKRVCNYLETWYWSAIFSGSFRLEQNTAFQSNLKELLKILCNMGTDKETKERPDYIISLCNKVFCDDKFANEDILLVDNLFIEPEDILSRTICQYYLSRTYSDMLKNGAETNYEQKEISVFYQPEGKGNLQRHHIMPIGELSTLYKKVEDEVKGECKREKLKKYNSPLNYILISPNANRLIMNNPLSYYIDYCDQGTLNKLGIVALKKEQVLDKNQELEQFLKRRYEKLCADLRELFAGNLEISEVDLKFVKTSV